MRQYIIERISLIGLLTVVLTTCLLTILSCADEPDKTDKTHNLSLTTRAGETAAEQIPSMRLFNFRQSDKKFYQEVHNLTRTADKITTHVEAGSWSMALVSTPNGGTIIPPAPNTVISKVPLYTYEPAYPTGGKTSNAIEIYLDNKPITITANTLNLMNAQLNRTVAKVRLIIEHTTPNFNLLSNKHKIKLHNIPSTISYTGSLLPNATTPDTLVRALESPVVLVAANSSSYKGFEPIEFIIPAHRGDAYTSAIPTDVVGVKMGVSLLLERTGGSMFFKQVEIPIVAQCNRVLEVKIKVNDGLEFKAGVMPWEGVDINSSLGAGYKNWLYVKKGGIGNGLSWGDPLPDISTAITKAGLLKTAGKTVNGILVAGGSASAMQYSESFALTQGVKVFGGWKGDPGTELASGDANAPYTSANRDLKTYKARVSVGTGNITLSGANAVLDGFVVTGSGNSSVSGLVTVNTGAWVNALEIDQQTISSNYALSITAGTGTNILMSRNSKGVSVASGGKLINATIAGNYAASVFAGTLLNSVYWGNSGTVTTTGIISYCAFQGTTPAGTNYPLHATNNTWFTASNFIPGPHFDLGTTSGLARYEAGTAKTNRSPMLRRGNKAAFDNNLPVALADLYKKDINGNIRYHIAIDGTTQVVDIGCYENGTHPGFQLTWATESVYVSSKKGYFSQLPLLLPANENPDINIGVKWTVTVQGGSLTACNFDGSVINDIATGSNTGSGTGVMVGMVQFTPTVEYTTNSERKLGAITISTQLGAYLPNVSINVMQTKGLRTEWKQGYVGSFHRNKERGARFVHAYNTGEWTARIFKGLDWIKIDANDKDYGVNIGDLDEGRTPSGGYYKDVEEQWGGVLKGSGYIKFRVGMKSKNTTGAPRYGLIIITRSGGVSYFFIRQGEGNDYLYRTVDTPKPTAGVRTATSVVKFSPYNLTDPLGSTLLAGRDIGARNGTFTKYPSQVGYYFKWNSTQGFLYGSAISTSSGITASSWSSTREVCPTNYRHPTYLDYCNSIYLDVANLTSVRPSGEDVKLNREWGAYADGWYDQLVTSPLSNSGPSPIRVGSGVGGAQKGVLMVSHYTYASVFFPGAGKMIANGDFDGNSGYAMYPTTLKNINTHWYNDHIGMSCTAIGSNAATVRCVYVGP